MGVFKSNFNLKILRKNENTFFYKTNFLSRLLPLGNFSYSLNNRPIINLVEYDRASFSDFFYFDVAGEEQVTDEANKVGQPFHIVNPSPYPFLLSVFFLFLFAFTICSVRSEFGILGFHWF